MLYLYLKAIHIVFVVSWMAGLFYSVRLFIYHTETNQKTEQEKQILFAQFKVMEQRLWNIITTPAMLITILAGLSMIYINPYLLQTDWMILKLLFVALLITYHFICQRIIKKLKNNQFTWTSTQLRLWNEVATLLLVAIVFTVVLKSTTDWMKGVIGLIGLGIAIMIAVKWYKNYRIRHEA